MRNPPDDGLQEEDELGLQIRDFWGGEREKGEEGMGRRGLGKDTFFSSSSSSFFIMKRHSRLDRQV